MSDDDKQHEYVPPVARDILDGQRIAAVAAYAEMQRKAYNLQASYDDAMGMLSAMTAERDALREPLAQARMHQVTLEKRIAELERERDEARLELRAVVNGTDQGIVALVVSVIEHRIRSERCEAEANNLAEALRQVNARLVDMTAERDAAEAWKENGKGYVKTLEANERVAKNRLFETQNQLQTLTEKHNDILRFIEAAKATYGPKTPRELDFVIRIGAAVKERDAARAWAGAWKRKAKQLRNQRSYWDARTRDADADLAEARARVAELEAEKALSQSMREDDRR